MRRALTSFWPSTELGKVAVDKIQACRSQMLSLGCKFVAPFHTGSCKATLAGSCAPSASCELTSTLPWKHLEDVGDPLRHSFGGVTFLLRKVPWGLMKLLMKHFGREGVPQLCL